MEKINIIHLLQSNHPDGLIVSRKVVTIIDFFPSVGEIPYVSLKWKIPAWITFEQDKIFDFEGVSFVCPTDSHMLVDVVLAHRDRGIDIYLNNLKDNLWYAQRYQINLKYLNAD